MKDDTLVEVYRSRDLNWVRDESQTTVEREEGRRTNEEDPRLDCLSMWVTNQS